MSKTGSKEMQVIHFDQEVQVCGLLNFLFELLCHASLSFALVLKIWAIFLSFSFLFFLSCSLAWILLFFRSCSLAWIFIFLFLYSPYFLFWQKKILERDGYDTIVEFILFGGRNRMFLRNS